MIGSPQTSLSFHRHTTSLSSISKRSTKEKRGSSLSRIQDLGKLQGSYQIGIQNQPEYQSKLRKADVNELEDGFMRNKLQKIGLQSFVKNVVLHDKNLENNYSQKIIWAFNKTYLTTSPLPPQSQLTERKHHRLSRFRSSVSPNKHHCPSQFVVSSPKGNSPTGVPLQNFLPFAMFPSRKRQKSKIKGREKRNMMQIQSNSQSSQGDYFFEKEYEADPIAERRLKLDKRISKKLRREPPQVKFKQSQFRTTKRV